MRTFRAAAQIPHHQPRIAQPRGFLGEFLLDRAADHHFDHLPSGELANGPAANHLTVAHDGDAIGDLKNLVQAVADVNDANSLGAQLAHDDEQPFDLLRRERGRRLVHHDDSGVDRQRLGDLDHLLLGNAQVATRNVGVDRDADPSEELPCGPPLVAAANKSPGGAFLAEKNIFRRGKGRNQVEFLINDRHAGFFRVGRAAKYDWLAENFQLACIRDMSPGQHFNQRAFARSVLPSKAKTSPRPSERSTPHSARTPGNDFSIPVIRSSGEAWRDIEGREG